MFRWLYSTFKSAMWNKYGLLRCFKSPYTSCPGVDIQIETEIENMVLQPKYFKLKFITIDK